MKLLLAGATGLVGQQVLQQALADDRITAIIAPTRRPLPGHPKLHAPQVDYDNLPAEAPWWQVDAVICTLGTTLKKAGSRAAFERIDHGYPLAVAQLARQHGVSTYALNSAIGADPASYFFYNRIKGQLERDLTSLGFTSLTLVRPGVIQGQRQESRPGERALLLALGTLSPLLPRRWHPSPAPNIAHALIDSALLAPSGVRIISAEALA